MVAIKKANKHNPVRREQQSDRAVGGGATLIFSAKPRHLIVFTPPLIY